ncbi:hypothetical protein PT974_01283 [Cladobotryum mycophilum]|uniref:Aminoglycoside phosphotransferase domain-containing protein n=1 Tax=Cladobotryum mycophilum TaxID=491253 RepID=A0ABR0T3U7_9HYPO
MAKPHSPAATTAPPPPSRRWSSFQGWEYNGLRERLESILSRLDKNALVQHAELIKGQECVMSEPFSAGQFWICFEIILETVGEEDEMYLLACEVNTMQFVRQRLPEIIVPQVYAYEGPGSERVEQVGAVYMLLEGFYGNTLHDVVPDICNLPVPSQEHIMSQWTMVQAQLATVTFPRIGSICSITESGEAVIDRLSHGAAGGLDPQGPFSNTAEYFTAIGEATLQRANRHHDDRSLFAKLGALAFVDIVQNTDLFQETSSQYPLNHMDLGMQNVLVDDEYNFLAVIDWEFAQTAPWQVNHFPMPFTILWPEKKIQSILDDPENRAYKYISKHASARELYTQKFLETERKLCEEGRPLGGSFAEAVESPASKIFARLTRLQCVPEEDKVQVQEMVRLAFGFVGEEADQYLKSVERKLGESNGTAEKND